ncbi:hypothetical protein MRX96_019140 [Rhipicephalus microplus]
MAATEKMNENNQRVLNHLQRLRHSLSASDKLSYQIKGAAAAAVNRRRYPDYVSASLGGTAHACETQARQF